MQKKLLKQMVQASFKNGKLDEKTALLFADHLKRQELKAYIKALKYLEQKHNVYIALPENPQYNTHKQELANLFPDKTVIFEEDPSLLLGMRITDNDMVHEVSLQKTLQSILVNIEDHYE